MLSVPSFLPSFLFSFTIPRYTSVQRHTYVFSTLIQLCIYCLIVLTLDLSAAYPELHIFLRRADLVSPGNRSSNLSPVRFVVALHPCAFGKNVQEFDNSILVSAL